MLQCFLSLHKVVSLPGDTYRGEVVEWFKAAVLKTAEVQASVGSNPTLSVTMVIPNQKVMRFL